MALSCKSCVYIWARDNDTLVRGQRQFCSDN
uniref:Uncharacterized protein n=1 Tax=Arundo donax TaxID=35708 RepID=A0A0A9GZ68_ARUDO